MSFTLRHLGLAYRKAKVDLFYSTNAALSAIADYEENLVDRLTSLLDRLNGGDEKWVEEEEFLGTWTVAPKSVSAVGDSGENLIFSSPAEKWDHLVEKKFAKCEAEFRVMAQCSLDLHVLSTLWILQVGHKYDAKLSDCAWGNRLRRTQKSKKINELSLGSFVPYLKPFRSWRDKGIDTMRSALGENKKIVALTADVNAFYHELNPDFMLDPFFINEVLKLELTKEEQKLNRLFVRALKLWAANTPLKKGVPVGLPASGVVANMALVELDRLIEQQVAPLYYGRYVDDIMLVMENGADFRSTAEMWEWLFVRSGGKLAWKNEKRNEVVFQARYLTSDSNSRSPTHIRFANSKNKVFILNGDTGRSMVEAIANEIYERASEWRRLPNLPHSARQVGTDLLAATQSDGDAADNLRKADAMTLRRASFAIKLRDFEAYERDLPPDVWKEHRCAFFQAFRHHVLVLPSFFELARYLPRVVRLATACEDFGELFKIIEALSRLSDRVKDCSIKIKAVPKGSLVDASELLSRWQKQLWETVDESIASAFPQRLSKAGKLAWKTMQDYIPSFERGSYLIRPPSARLFQAQHARLFAFDLAHLPFRFIGLPAEMIAQRGIPPKKDVRNYEGTPEVLPEEVFEGINLLARWSKLKGVPHGLLFATRPFGLSELFVLHCDTYTDGGKGNMRAVVLALRGFTPSDEMPRLDADGVLRLSRAEKSSKCRIAVSSWKTQQDSWIAAVKGLPDPDFDRFARLNRLLDGVISHPHNCRYLVLPELALPAKWFIRIAKKLQGRGISLIAGIEYLHSRRAVVHNQVWMALTHDGLGFPSMMIYRQDKQRPALHEEQELHRLAGLKLRTESPAWAVPPVAQHGEFRFALMVCSELTNIAYRAALRGKIDALFVPEWNQDTETFNALVEAAALDMHAYIIQCNDRQYGDSRIRGPYKESWQRELLRVRGGITDYCVIGEIDIQALRQFQSSYRSPPKPFKPVPDGFKIAYARRVLPAEKPLDVVKNLDGD